MWPCPVSSRATQTPDSWGHERPHLPLPHCPSSSAAQKPLQLARVTPHLIPVATPGLGPSWGRKAPVPWSSERLDVRLWGAASVSGWPGAQGCAAPDRPVSARPAPRGGPGRAGQGPEPRPFSSIAGRHLALCAPRVGPSLSRAHQAGVLSGSRELPEFQESCSFSRPRLRGPGTGAQGRWTPGQRGCFHTHGWRRLPGFRFHAS